MIPTNTNVSVDVKTKSGDADAVAVFIGEGEKKFQSPLMTPEAARGVERLIAAGVVQGKSGEIAFDLVGEGKKSHRVYVIGLGKIQEVTLESIRKAGGALARAARKHKLRRVAIVTRSGGKISPAQGAAACVEGFLLASFSFEEFKGSAAKKDEDAKDRQPIALTVVANDSEVRAAVDRARIICEGQNFARTIASRPGNVINPPALAKVAQQLAREVGLGIHVLDEKHMAKRGMGGILAVGQGSDTPPRIIVLAHRPGGVKATRARKKALPVLLVVGKSITFDTGGISIKPAEKMGDMVYDKCGGMAVLGLMYAVAKLKLNAHVVGILSSAENMPSGHAYRPGDIIKFYSGVTCEVTNTDAEGRLVLHDAIAWGIETFKPAACVDLATLTGGVVVALGETMAGVMSNDDDLVAEFQRAADQSGEKIWRLPVGEDQRKQIKSHHADIVNSAGRTASPLQGAAFISYAVPDNPKTPWAHFDIAGVADTDKELPYYTKGATGWGVRMLVEWVAARANGNA